MTLRELSHARLWRALAWLGVAATLVVSLLPMPDLGVHEGDKLGHLAWYFALTAWFAQLVATRRALAAHAFGLLALGAAIEVLQSWTAWRTGDWRDLAANATGIAAGVALGLTPARHWLARVETHLGRPHQGR